ncbi:hypothetical protein D3C85_1875700 [compost metagenome]
MAKFSVLSIGAKPLKLAFRWASMAGQAVAADAPKPGPARCATIIRSRIDARRAITV